MSVQTSINSELCSLGQNHWKTIFSIKWTTAYKVQYQINIEMNIFVTFQKIQTFVFYKEINLYTKYIKWAVCLDLSAQRTTTLAQFKEKEKKKTPKLEMSPNPPNPGPASLHYY